MIEGACRHLVKDRMDITGARWGLAGAEAILEPRALITNGDFDQYWQYHLAHRRHRNHVLHYANGVIPRQGIKSLRGTRTLIECLGLFLRTLSALALLQSLLRSSHWILLSPSVLTPPVHCLRSCERGVRSPLVRTTWKCPDLGGVAGLPVSVVIPSTAWP